MSKDVMKLALEALENSWTEPGNKQYEFEKEAITALREALAEPDFWEGYVPEPDKRQQALDKKAENARELGLDYEPAQQEFVSPGGGYVPAIPAQQRPIKTFHGGKAWPVQEPAQPVPDAFEQLMREADKPTQVPEGIAKYVDALVKGTHEITSVTIRPKRTWVGLTDEEITDMWAESSPYYHEDDFARAIEAKLRSKNEDRN